MNKEYSADCIQFAEIVSDMMAKRKKVEEIKSKACIASIYRKYNGYDYARAVHALHKAEREVNKWLKDIFGLED